MSTYNGAFFKIVYILAQFSVTAICAFISIHTHGFSNVIDQVQGWDKVRSDDGNIRVHLLDRFFHIPFLDDSLKPIIIAFAPSTSAIDPVSWFQMLSFLVDFTFLYSLWIFESVRYPSPNFLNKLLVVLLPTQYKCVKVADH